MIKCCLSRITEPFSGFHAWRGLTKITCLSAVKPMSTRDYLSWIETRLSRLSFTCHSFDVFFCSPTRRSSCLCAWTSWQKSLPVIFSMCLTRRWHLRRPCCGWINVPLVNRALKRSVSLEFCTLGYNLFAAWTQFSICPSAYYLL